MKLNGTIGSAPAHVLSSPFVCKKLYPKNKLNQKSEKMQKQRKAIKQDKIIMV